MLLMQPSHHAHQPTPLSRSSYVFLDMMTSFWSWWLVTVRLGYVCNVLRCRKTGKSVTFCTPFRYGMEFINLCDNICYSVIPANGVTGLTSLLLLLLPNPDCRTWKINPEQSCSQVVTCLIIIICRVLIAGLAHHPHFVMSVCG